MRDIKDIESERQIKDFSLDELLKNYSLYKHKRDSIVKSLSAMFITKQTNIKEEDFPVHFPEYFI